jgi:hypothetical protein
MSKKSTKLEVIPADQTNARTSDISEITEADRASASQLGIDLGASIEACMTRAAAAANEAALRAVEAGYLLMRVKDGVGHGGFEEALEGIGMSRQRASEFMRMARFTSLLPEDKRASIVSIGRSKVLALAGADKQVIDLIVDEGVEAVDALTVRELRDRIRELEANQVDMQAAKDAAEAERDVAQKKLAKGQAPRQDHVPTVFADLRAEMAALKQKASASLSSIRSLGVDLAGLGSVEGASDWIDPTASLCLAGLIDIHLQVRTLITTFMDSFELRAVNLVVDDNLDPVWGLSPQELTDVAKQWSALMQEHDYEKALREWEREQARPRGKGRPSAKPDAPKGR